MIAPDTVVLDGEITLLNEIDGELEKITIVERIEGEVYDGPYEVTPSQQTQRLETRYKTATQDIVINPIPSNYGLITWNGFEMTVS